MTSSLVGSEMCIRDRSRTRTASSIDSRVIVVNALLQSMATRVALGSVLAMRKARVSLSMPPETPSANCSVPAAVCSVAPWVRHTV
eukprot:3760463-Prorocentrum_lima.AAC.1